jgi:hypothetical protein
MESAVLNAQDVTGALRGSAPAYASATWSSGGEEPDEDSPLWSVATFLDSVSCVAAPSATVDQTIGSTAWQAYGWVGTDPTVDGSQVGVDEFLVSASPQRVTELMDAMIGYLDGCEEFNPYSGTPKPFDIPAIGDQRYATVVGGGQGTTPVRRYVLIRQGEVLMGMWIRGVPRSDDDVAETIITAAADKLP